MVKYNAGSLYSWRFARAEDLSFIAETIAPDPNDTTVEPEFTLASAENLIMNSEFFLWLNQDFFPEEVIDNVTMHAKHRNHDDIVIARTGYNVFRPCMIFTDLETGQDVGFFSNKYIRMEKGTHANYGMPLDALNKWVGKTDVAGLHPDHRGDKRMIFLRHILHSVMTHTFPAFKIHSTLTMKHNWDLENRPVKMSRNKYHADALSPAPTAITAVDAIKRTLQRGTQSDIKHAFGGDPIVSATSEYYYPVRLNQKDLQKRGGAAIEWAGIRAFKEHERVIHRQNIIDAVGEEAAYAAMEMRGYFANWTNPTEIGKNSDGLVAWKPNTSEQRSIKKLVLTETNNIEWVDSKFF